MNSKIKYILLGLSALVLTSCAGSDYHKYPTGRSSKGGDHNPTYSYYGQSSRPGENTYQDPQSRRTVNVSLTSSTFSYPCVREAINHNSLEGAAYAARVEEMLNYFSYGYLHEGGNALSTTLELRECPWNPSSYLASVVVKAKTAPSAHGNNNFVILVDRSGSMQGVFDLVKKSLNALIDKLTINDTVSIVSYASGVTVEADGLTGSESDQLRSIVNNLTASGSTWGEGGIEKAYELANKHFIEGGNNRVVLLTDGDFNVGQVTGGQLTRLIKQKAQSGVYLTCCGYRCFDNGTLYALSENGNGNAYYIDGELEATKVFDKEFDKAMYTVAKDAKCQIEFSNAVTSYRLIGYETRQMSDQEFEDPQTDAGEIMSDHTTVALYELKLRDVWNDDFIFKATLNYKDAATNGNKTVTEVKNTISIFHESDFFFASYVAEYGLLLINSQYKGIASYSHLLDRINNTFIDDVYRQDFVATVRKTRDLQNAQ